MDNVVSWREKYRVRIGFAMGILFLWRAQPQSILFLTLGLSLALLGVLLRQWAAGCVKKMDELAQTGPYALVRHPLYVGSCWIAFGLILASSSISFSLTNPALDRTLLFWALFWILLDSIYLPKVYAEEGNLSAKFGESWNAYIKTVPRFVPKTFSLKKLDFSTFSWPVWKHNREWGSLCGYILLTAILIARYVYG